jgi:predicted amidohydrolase YtcJ
MLRIVGVKAFYDGALGSRGALLLAPYNDRPAERGRGGAEYGFDATLMTGAMARGFEIMIHAIGDAGNRQTLDFFESAFAMLPNARNRDHRIEHAQILAPADIERFAQLGVIASMQPGHAVEDMAWAEQRVGAERIKGGYAWRTLRKSGARLMFNSDMPGSSYDIFYMLHSAITRTDPKGMPAGGWFPNERMTPEEAVRGFTTSTGRDANVIAVGRRADLTLLDRDPFVTGTNEPARLIGGKAVATIVGGRIVSTTLDTSRKAP